jgi:hypothetical protein
MRLLHTSSLTLHEYFDESVPPYGILSHTWAENEEVSYQEMLNLSSLVMAKTGYQKIINCAHTIKELGYDYVWIDTCCIDKSSSAELSESINSMYNFYKNSKVCLAYMADVHRDTGQPSLDESAFKSWGLPENYPNFQSSRWFTRGWTLQELIAPTNVVFYDSEWQVIARIQEIAKAVERFIEIPELVLLFGITESYCVAEKMKWASKRRTTRREDMAYCLFGLFNIHMPLLYGEGDRAFERLQEKILKRSEDLSLFLWQDEEDSEYVHRGLLARSPAEFSKFTISRRAVNMAPTRPIKLHYKSWNASKSPCWITNIGVQLSVHLLEARSFYKSAILNADYPMFFENPKDDEYVFNVINFHVGSTLISFYILLKRLEKDGNQFARLLPGRISSLERSEGHDYRPPPKLETIFIRQNLKVKPTIIDPRIYGFSLYIALSERSLSGPVQAPQIQEASDVLGQSCSRGLMGKLDGNNLLPAVVSQDGIVSGFLITLSHRSSLKTFCVLVRYQPLGVSHLRVDLECFDGAATPELCSTYSFSDMSPRLRGMTLDGSRIVARWGGYTLDRGRVLVVIAIAGTY